MPDDRGGRTPLTLPTFRPCALAGSHTSFGRTISGITALGLLVRVLALLMFEEAPGDGPSRAALGWEWYLTHYASFHGHWLPGHSVLIGFVLHLAPDPALAGRLLSLTCGTASLPLLAALTRRLFGWPWAAAVAALLLALNPLHVALSVTSLSEGPAIFALLALLLAAFRLADEPRRPGAWAAVAAASLMGASIRFEFWLALPVVLLHHLVRTRSVWRGVLLALLLAPFPALWHAQRLPHSGLAVSYAGTVSGREVIGAYAVDAASGTLVFGTTLLAALGAPLLLLAALGLVGLSAGVRRPGRRADLAALLLLLAVQAACLARLATDFGVSFRARFVAAEAVLLLPLAGFAVAACLRPRPVAGAAVLMGALAMLHAAQALDLDLVRGIPEPTRQAAAWVARRPPDEAFLMTRMGWQSTYVPVLARLDPQRYRTVSHWLPDEELRHFARTSYPAYVITRGSDGDLLERLCRVAGLKARADGPVARFGGLAVLPLAPEPEGCATPRG
jgi:4-amino-4-deoxy-L-arabinose transferase-like glycosyltransferase